MSENIKFGELSLTFVKPSKDVKSNFLASTLMEHVESGRTVLYTNFELTYMIRFDDSIQCKIYWS
jgi:hypothetical protein